MSDDHLGAMDPPTCDSCGSMKRNHKCIDDVKPKDEDEDEGQDR